MNSSQGISRRSTNDLYAELQPQLVRILSSNVRAPQWVIDEACQSAWSAFLLSHRGEVEPGAELGWLSTAATRVALRVLRAERARRRCEGPPLTGGWAELLSVGPEGEPEHRVELRERLAEVYRLPERQRRLVMLHGFGYEYEEIAAATGETRRTVQRQLARARQRLRAVDTQA
jgi:RNA polymerase sigma factor (sigma-70 family)